MTLVCTGFAPSGYEQYGRRFLETFALHWPESVDLATYTEEWVLVPRGDCRSLWDCDGARAFYDRHRKDSRRTGRTPIHGWRMKDRRVGYSWRFDVVRFFKQCVIPANAMSGLRNGELLVWLDADVVTFAPVPPGLLEQMLGDADLAYLGRAPYHSEIGFWIVRANERSRWFVNELARLFVSDEVLVLSQHHSAFAFDYCRLLAERVCELKTVNLTEKDGHAGHVWFSMPLGQYTDHLKGPQRKVLGHSPENPSKWWEAA
jgi:hypothetical protein